MKIIMFGVLIFIAVLPLSAQSFKGDIVGYIIDGKTQEPLPVVNVRVVELPAFGAVTDSSGNFSIHGIPVGTYSLKATLIGYESMILTNVVVSTGRSTKTSLKLFEQAVEVGGVTVRASYFTRNNEIAPLSVNSYDRAEVKRQPGSVQDVQRVVQNLPGVASSNDNMNELIVRGGAPYENLTVMEHMEIPSINHYPNEFNSSGPINMVNIDLVEDVQFSAGGFPAQYGDKISSIMDITIREGDREKGFASNTGFNMAGFGTLMEGRLADGKGSWILSARRSFLEVIDQMIGMSAISLTAIPKYWDAQTKIVYDLSPTQKLTLNGLFGDSRIYIDGNPKQQNKNLAGMTTLSSVENVNNQNKQYALGMNLKSLWGKEGYSVLSLYTVGTQYNTDVQQVFSDRRYDRNGNVVSYQFHSAKNVFNSHNDEAFYALKYELFYKVHPQHDFRIGAQLFTASHWIGRTTFGGDTIYYDLNQNGRPDPLSDKFVISPNGDIPNAIHFGDASKGYAYVSDRYRIAPRLALTLGVRYDYFTYSGKGHIGPRANIAYELIPYVTTVSFAAGEYWQTQPFPNYSDRQNIGYNKSIDHAKAQHAVLGLQHILDDGVKMSLETYYKKFSQIPIEEQYIHSLVDTLWTDRQLAVGRRTSYGLEFLLQKKQVTNYYGTISVSLSKTLDEDPRIGKEGRTYPSQYDYPVIVNLVGGKVVKGIRSWLDEQPFFIKYPSYILPLSDEMEISFRYRYQTGKPSTPRIFNPDVHYREGGIQWSKGSWEYNKNEVNSTRYPDYSRIDIEWISRFYMERWNINVYIALMNVLNHKNVFYYEYKSDGTIEPAYQFAFFPVGGIEIEF
ncbi:MAG: TonB-dependent receptor [Ignavibacteriae bacterium]|nr:MAG: TonB-dependent receptor [Ignavibacteriota bacterium]